MCMKASCTNCNKVSWVGCGSHIPSVMDKVPLDQHCSCEPKVDFNGKQYPPKAGSALMAGVSGMAGGLMSGAKNVIGWATGSGKTTDDAGGKKKEEL